MKMTVQLIEASQQLLTADAFAGADESRADLIADIRDRTEQLYGAVQNCSLCAGTTLTQPQVGFLQALRSRLQDYYIASIPAARAWLDAFNAAFDTSSTVAVLKRRRSAAQANRGD